MKDNLPNYLNPHNIDPSRIEPAHIEDLPGFDSIRPGMNIGTVAFVGRGSPKFNFDDTAKTCAAPPPTMSNAEAIEVLKHIETDIYGRIAIGKAIDALRITGKETVLDDNGNSAHSHTLKPYSQPSINLLPEVICPKCGKPMYKTGSFSAGVIQCELHRWKCDDCGIQREQAHDWPIFQPREWHRPQYSIKGGEWIGEDETEKLKAALDALTEVEP